MTSETINEPMPLKADAHGVLRMGGTRVTLNTLIAAYHEGASAEEIAEQYPSIMLADIYASLGYYLRHRPEIEGYLAISGAESERVRDAAKRRHGAWPDLRTRLVDRHTR